MRARSLSITARSPILLILRKARFLVFVGLLLPGTAALLLSACPGASPNAPSSDAAPADASAPTGDAGPDSSQGMLDATTDATVDSPAPIDAPGDAPGDAPTDAGDGGPHSLCQLPGAVVFTASGKTVVPGGNPTDPSLSFLTLPAGFCAHYYATVPNARQIRFAPGGELFVASPSANSTGGGPGGLNAFVILPDDNHDGLPEAPVTFLSFGSGATNQGMLFAPGFFYFQGGTAPGTKIMRMPYNAGDRSPSDASVQVADITVYTSTIHWPKTLDVADDGTIYVGNSGDQAEPCDPTHPFHGGILKIDPVPGGANPGGVQVAKGFRNPIAVRCERGKNLCFALELAKDYTAGAGGREKLVPIRQGDDWGFPCCATQGLPYPGSPTGTDCSGVTAENNSFYVGDTPFGLDFEPGLWPSPWTNRVFVVTHGAAGSWTGARMVAIPTDSTGMPTPSTNANADASDVGFVDFATGWDDGTMSHGRPAAVSFSSDGRLFVASDNNGVIFWISPSQ